LSLTWLFCGLLVFECIIFSVVSTLSVSDNVLPTEKMIHSKTNSPQSNNVSDNVLTTEKMIHSKTNSPQSNHVSDNVLTTSQYIVTHIVTLWTISL
jgi:hypothetical protein